MHLPQPTGVVREIVRRPIAVMEVLPGGEAIILRHRVLDVLCYDGLPNVVHIPFECVFGCVHANDVEAIVFVVVVKLDDVLVGALAVDAGIGPKIHQGHLPRGGRINGLVGVDPVL